MFYTRFNPCKCGGLKCKPTTYKPVQKQFKGICDINNIVRRAFSGDPTVFRAARYGDISGAPESLHEALQSQVDSNNAYDLLPLEVRQAYPTPEEFYAACHNPKEVDKLRVLGVVEPEVVDTPIDVNIVNKESVSSENNG